MIYKVTDRNRVVHYNLDLKYDQARRRCYRYSGMA